MPETTSALTPEQISNIVVVSGSINPELAQATVDSIGVPLGKVNLERFPDGEFHPTFEGSLRGKEVFFMQSLGRRHVVDQKTGIEYDLSVNDAIIEQQLMIDAATRASATEMTAIIPYLAYGRGDKKHEGREPISAAYLIDAYENSQVKRLMSVDIHSGQSQGHFKGPYDHLLAQPVLLEALREIMGDEDPGNFLMVAPDEGRLTVATVQADKLGIDVDFIPKKRLSGSSVSRKKVNLDAADGRTCFVVDDIISTGGTIISAADMLIDAGAIDVYVGATHGTLPGRAVDKLADSRVKQFIITDTLPMQAAKEALGDRLKVVSMAPLIGQAIVQIVTKGSISALFDGKNNL